jgi:hypothetical protein
MAKLLEKHNDNVLEPFPDDNLAHTHTHKVGIVRWYRTNGELYNGIWGRVGIFSRRSLLYLIEPPLKIAEAIVIRDLRAPVVI